MASIQQQYQDRAQVRRPELIVFWMLLCSVTSAMAQVSIGIGIALPGVSIGINLPM